MEETIAGGQPVEKAPEINPAVSQEKTAEQLLAEAQAKIDKLAEEKDNYRRGMLKAKGKLPEEEDGQEDLETLVERKVQEKLYDATIQEAEKQKDELIKRTLKENAELKQLAKSKGFIPTSMGSNQDKPEVKTEQYFSPEQTADLAKRAERLGISTEKYISTLKENLKKGSDLPGASI